PVASIKKLSRGSGPSVRIPCKADSDLQAFFGNGGPRAYIELVAVATPLILERMKMKVIVTPKATVLDPQGAAVRDAMQHLGMPEVRSVRIGKYLEIEIDEKAPNLESRLHELCRDLLSNPVIEDYEVQGIGTRK